MPIHEFFEIVQKACLPGIWSKGVAITRSEAIIEDSRTADEIILRIKTKDHPVSRKVTLWLADEDWYCDCEDRNSVCPHVAAAVIAMKTGLLQKQSTVQTQTHPTRIHYCFEEAEQSLTLQRWLVVGSSQKELLKESLVGIAGGVSSGRISLPALAATQEDFAVDSLISSNRSPAIDRSILGRLFKAISQCSNLFFQGQSITVSPQPIQVRAQLIAEKDGYRLKQVDDPNITQIFRNGAVLCANVLRGIEIPNLTSQELGWITPPGKFFGPTEVSLLLTQALPALQAKMPVEILAPHLPKIKKVPPRIILNLTSNEEPKTLSVSPQIVYGDPHSLFLPDPMAEKALLRKLQSELQLTPGHTVTLEGEAAVDFVIKTKGWETRGNGREAYSLKESIEGKIEFSADEMITDFDFSFQSQSGHVKADPQAVFRAWRENRNYVPLLTGGWTQLPKNWLEKYGEKIESFLRAKNDSETLPTYLLPQVTQICEDLGQTYPDWLVEFRKKLSDIECIPTSVLPGDLTASLRSYQQNGVNWLSFLRDSGMGAMLADDMGLGKTLQALCSFQGRTLIVAPTSVLPNWKNQIKNFRPSLSVCIYHGTQRTLDPKADVILTSYALLRLEREKLTQENWDTAVLDEAQVIKNPDSQVAQSAHRIRARFRIALSGTPIENRLSDLWSQFQFLNPGLLGSQEEFNDSYSSPIAQGNQVTALELQKKIRPFILRRLKQEVAPELPAKTESVLYCELDEEERETYSALLASTRKEVLEKLEKGDSVFAALELLLRLRQACCHTSLIPGHSSDRKSSSKLDLLIQTLKQSIELGHRALVFSQWTSYLDLIEPLLRSHHISFNRLDGASVNRDQIIQDFQSPSGPSVMLISLKAGGMGLTLTAADHVFLMDPWWNPSIENQATDRTHRIGQNNPVFVYRLIAQNTIEERVMILQKAKSSLAGQILQDFSDDTSLGRDDLFDLLQDLSSSL